MLPHTFSRKTVASQFWAMFCDRDLIDPAVSDLMVDEFRRIYHSAGARYAFLSSARNIYLEKPFGRGGFYPRLAELEQPALFVWGSHDPPRPGGVLAPCAPMAADRPAGHDRALRPRAAGGAPGGDERAADGLLRRGEQERAPGVDAPAGAEAA